ERQFELLNFYDDAGEVVTVFVDIDRAPLALIILVEKVDAKYQFAEDVLLPQLDRDRSINFACLELPLFLRFVEGRLAIERAVGVVPAGEQQPELIGVGGRGSWRLAVLGVPVRLPFGHGLEVSSMAQGSFNISLELLIHDRGLLTMRSRSGKTMGSPLCWCQ